MKMKDKQIQHAIGTKRNAPRVATMHKIVNRVAQVIVKDIKQGVRERKSISGGKIKKLKPATIKAKRRAGNSNPSMPLVATGRMVGKGGKGGSEKGGQFGPGGTGIYIDKEAKPNAPRTAIRIPADRVYIAGIHNEGLGDMPKREWFGISKRAEKTADIMVKEWAKTLFLVR